MQRLFAFVAAVILTTLTVSSACTAAPAGTLSFTLEPSGKGERIQAHFRKTDRDTNNWSSSFAPGELTGLDQARFRAPGTSPLHFALVREAGRIDCAGNGGNSLARGTCNVTSNPAFLDLFSRRGIGRPNEEQTYGLIALDVRRELIETLAAAHYPTPTIDQLMGLTAVGATDRYISGLARVGYRPQTLDGLLQFAALGITPEFIQGYVRMGYGKLPAEELIQLKALNVTADYIAGFERIGYGRLPAEVLVQLKALDVTSEWVAGFQRLGYRRLPVGKLIQMKALGVTPEFVRSFQRDRAALPTPDQIVKLRALGFARRRR